MLSEKKIRKMIRLSEYENGLGSADLKRMHYKKTDYIRLELLKTAVAVLAACLLFLLLIGMCYMDYLMIHIFDVPFRKAAVLAGLGLVLVEIPALVVTGHIAKRRYEEAESRIKEYEATLHELLELYEEEERQEDSAL